MTRGNQREMDRLKAAKKAAAAKKPKESSTSLAKRREGDADILRAKQKACQDPIPLLGGLIPCSRLGYTEERGGESRTRGKDGGERGLKKGI
ncbi:hypothetical protein SCLCIDRAFT_648598 [Scleroderma citrinum Foug A]|uniref:Small EDRK-rich factor-like N-terminal domain-containing protein n=1 Tax=Scleroderma citrinum Foug A TaxID=1036808 RepID=A0A0C3CRZ5_9AGAM|nr:hypothetical protein SCLCIDRAFT_648598 [Scleroderma citrinum Foug A]